MKNYDPKSLRFEQAKERVKKIKGFNIHLLVYFLVNITLFILNSRGEGIFENLRDPDNYFFALIWGLGLVTHWIRLFGTNIFLGKNLGRT